MGPDPVVRPPAGLLVIHPGVFTTVQDHGRPGYRAWGVPVGGAFDVGSFDLANALLGNEPGCAALELTWLGGTYQATIPLAIALAGAPMEAVVESPGGRRAQLRCPQTAQLWPGDRLRLGTNRNGARTYLAVRGGWRTPLKLGSRSTEDRLRAGDVLPAEPGNTPVRRLRLPTPSSAGSEPIRILDGPDADSASRGTFDDDRTYRVSEPSDRMGLRLEGDAGSLATDPDRISTPIAPGAVQHTGSRLLILGVACGTMGGYPHLAQVVSADLDRLGQLRPGDEVRFRRTSLEEARRLDQDDRRLRAEQVMRTSALASDHGSSRTN